MPMREVTFTKRVDKDFGGKYSTPNYSVKAGESIRLPLAEIQRLEKDHPGLIGDKGKVEETPEDADADPEKTEDTEKVAPRGQDKMMRGGRRKKK